MFAKLALTLREERFLGVLENWVMRGVFWAGG